jgi:cytochrome c biogenesis factor
MSDEPPTVPQLVKAVQADVARLVRAEVALARTEVTQLLRRGAAGVGLVVVGLVMLLPVVLAVVLCVGFALVHAGLGTSIAFLVTAGIFLALTVVLMAAGALVLKKVRAPQAPQRVKADLAAVKHHQAA